MSQRTRAIRKKRKKRRRILIAIFLIVLLLVFGFWRFRSSQRQILEPVDYVHKTASQLFLLRDSDYLKIDDFSAESLAVKEGTKVSGYNGLTTAPMLINAEYINNQVDNLKTLIDEKIYDDWDGYSRDMQKVLSHSQGNNGRGIEFYEATARYSPENEEELKSDKEHLEALATNSPSEITLNAFGIMKTGFVLSGVSEYDELACEAALGSLSVSMINDISRLNTNDENALRIVNNDHCYAVTSIDKGVSIQGEEETVKLKKTFKEGLSNSEYYRMLVTRVDRLRQFPEISFTKDNKTFPAYLVDIQEDADKKILVLLIKEYNYDLLEFDKLNCDINDHSFKAYIVPQTAIIKKDDKTYIQELVKGYRPEEIEVKVSLSDRGKAILSLADNPDLKSETTIRTYPN